MRYIIKISLVLLCISSVLGDGVLNDLPVTFSMTGSVSYIPDNGGGTQNGYELTLGYSGSSWLAVEFVAAGLYTDVLVLQIDDFYTNSGNPLFSGHRVTYSDYFKNSNGLRLDTITTYDVSAYAYSNTMTYSLPITRYIGSNSGQDWDADANKYSVLKVCFYTSEQTFSLSTYNQFYSACYNYEINNLVSTFVGAYLKSFTLNGHNTSIYGYVDGPLVQNKLYFYQQTTLFGYLYVPAAVIEIGTTSGNVGQDFYASSPVTNENGDYYGSDISQIKFDNLAAGYQNPALTLLHWNADPSNPISGLQQTSLRMFFSRDVYTYDQYDKTMLSTFIFCIYLYSSGSIKGALSDKACEIV
jgi:hypothetical protein